jgi:hypothetical protein
MVKRIGDTLVGELNWSVPLQRDQSYKKSGALMAMEREK